ncbi:hypothetical protein A3D79_02780 [Candidatus Daviesbacteria bacterium RIFCSPHIGHO2_02_FULL_39_8]|nr:MAG: hypothetical protein A3D79_02780 [Candidatus Daviesbacteria bacterium RIFCSPHIGHO2_02_FULL_39_8]
MTAPKKNLLTFIGMGDFSLNCLARNLISQPPKREAGYVKILFKLVWRNGIPAFRQAGALALRASGLH